MPSEEDKEKAAKLMRQVELCVQREAILRRRIWSETVNPQISHRPNRSATDRHSSPMVEDDLQRNGVAQSVAH
jgi:hypothetical protein